MAAPPKACSGDPELAAAGSLFLHPPLEGGGWTPKSSPELMPFYPEIA